MLYLPVRHLPADPGSGAGAGGGADPPGNRRFAPTGAGRPGTADEVARVAQPLVSARGAFITGAGFLLDGGATASYFYGPPRPEA